MSETVQVDAPVEWLVTWRQFDEDERRWIAHDLVLSNRDDAARFAHDMELIGQAIDRVRYVELSRRAGTVPANEWTPLAREHWPTHTWRDPNAEHDDTTDGGLAP